MSELTDKLGWVARRIVTLESDLRYFNKQDTDRLLLHADRMNVACGGLGSWMSAALEDTKVCKEMKASILIWMEKCVEYTNARASATAKERENE